MARNTKTIFVTADGLKQMEEELKFLQETRRAEIAAKLKRSLEFGDLSENAEYQEAKEEQAFVEARIAELEEQLKHVELIEEKGERIQLQDVIQIGSTVTLQNITEHDDPETYTIVGSMEADPLNGKISNESPIGSAILDKKKGDVVKVKVPAGVFEYKILQVN
jgi:transcription elongation factor GreA